MECAAAWAKRSTCFRLNVGAVIVVDRTIIAHGYNGVPSGHAHCTGNDCPGKFECKLTTHAEVNALERWQTMQPAAYWGRCYDKGGANAPDMYCTDSPCAACALAIEDAGIKRVFFATLYRLTEALDYLTVKGVGVYRVTPAGYVINWETKDVMETIVV